MPDLRTIPEGSVLGLNYSGLHDSALVAVGPAGDVRFACALERVTRSKRDGRWPAVLLEQVPWARVRGVGVSALDYEAARALRERAAVDGWPLRVEGGEAVMGRYAAVWEELLASLPVPVWRYDHHECHAVSAFAPSGFADALVLTCDAGAYHCPWFAAAYRGRAGRGSGDVALLGGMAAGLYRSPANVYTVVTALLGLQPNNHEGKVTGLAARGATSPARIADFEARIWPMVTGLGELMRWDVRFTGDVPSVLSVNAARARRYRGEFADFSDADLAATVQAWAEDKAAAMLERALELCGEDRPRALCLAGGLFANVRINQALVERFEHGFVAPPMTDDGTAYGAALLAHRQEYPEAPRADARATMYLGHTIEADEVERVLAEAGIAAAPPDATLPEAIADLLAAGRTVAVARGAMEFGPRALGHRSILRRADDPTVNDWLNRALHRTEYMPFAPMTPDVECDASYRDPRLVSAFMTVTVGCTDAMAASSPAVVHVDGTARPQRLTADDDAMLYEALGALRARTGSGTVINTSFNMHEEPIVCTAADALLGFAQAGLDALCLGDRLVLRAGNEDALWRLVKSAEARAPRADKLAALSRWLDDALIQLGELRRLKREWFDPELERLEEEVAARRRAAELGPEVQAARRQARELEQRLAAKEEQLRQTVTELGAIQSSLTWKANRAFDMLRRGDLRGLAGHLKRFLGHRLGGLARRYVRRPAALTGGLGRLEARRPPRDPAPLAELRARVAAFLPAPPPSVTAVVPCYNYGRLVRDAVDSLRAQTYPALEIVVVDDGSTDGETLRALAELEQEGVRVVHQENRGLVGARNAGARESDGELLLFLDNDDLLEPEAVALLVAHLAAHDDRAFAYPSQRFFGDVDLCWEPQEYDAYDLLWSNHPTVCSLVRRSAFAEVGGYNADMVFGWEDWEHWIALSERGHHGTRVPVPVFRHRRHGKTMTHDAAGKGGYLRAAIRDAHPALYEPAAITRIKRRWRPAVSVVVPFCNAHEHWPETLASLQAQTLDDFEVVVVNDASDDPAALAALAGLRDGGAAVGLEVRVVDRPERGDLAAARNTGVRAARADFVFFLDPDDLILPTALEKLCWLLLNTPEAGFVYSGVEHFGARTGVCIDEYDVERLKRENFLTSAAMVRRDVYLQAGGMEESERLLFEDYDFWLRLAALGVGGRLLPEVLFRYRRHAAGRSAWVRRQLDDGQMLRLLARRNPVLFGKAKEHPPHYRPMAEELTPLGELEQDLRARHLAEQRLKCDSYRRPGYPNMFPAKHWDDARPRVLYVIPHMTVGGAERIDLDILHGLRAGGVFVSLAVEKAGDDEWAPRFAAAADEVCVVGNVAPAAHGAARFLDHRLISRNVDVVFVRNAARGYELAERWHGRCPHVRFVDLLHVHNFGADWCRLSTPYDRFLHRRYVTNDDLRDYVRREHRLDHDRFRRIYCGVDVAALDRAAAGRNVLRDLVGAGPGRPVIGFVGRLDEQKNPQLWLDAAARIAERAPDAVFVMIGDGPLRGAVARQLERMPCRDRVHLLGYRDDVVELAAGMDLLLMTSRYEGLPQVVFEAMGVGVPVVTSDAGGTRECVTPDVGVVVPLDSGPVPYADAVAGLLADRRRLAMLSDCCRARVRERFDVATMQDAYRREIASLCENLDRRARLRAYQDQLMQKSPI